MLPIKVKIVLLKDGILPKKATPGSAAFDVYAPVDFAIRPGRQIMPLNFKLEMPYGYEAKIEPRSGFSSKGLEGYHASTFDTPGRYDVDILSGKVDADYRGICGVIIHSHENATVFIPKGTRIAQMTFYEVPIVDFDEVAESDLTKTERADGGFGHSKAI